MPFKKGESGNPHGVSSKRKSLQKRFLNDLLDSYEEVIIKNGKETTAGYRALCEVRDEEPVKYVQALINLMPKDVQVEVTESTIWTELLRDGVIAAAEGTTDSADDTEVAGVPPGIRH